MAGGAVGYTLHRTVQDAVGMLGKAHCKFCLVCLPPQPPPRGVCHAARHARRTAAAAVERNASKQDLGKESLLRRLPAEQWADASPLPPPRRLAALAAAHIFVSVCDVFCSS